MNENDIRKALDWCEQFENNLVFKGNGDEKFALALQMMVVIKHALKNYNRQKAEIERLENDIEEMADRLGVLLWHATDGMLSKSNYTTEVMVCALNDHIQRCCEEAEAEAIKEFEDRILEKAMETGNYFQIKAIITSVKKEMVGERE